MICSNMHIILSLYEMKDWEGVIVFDETTGVVVGLLITVCKV